MQAEGLSPDRHRCAELGEKMLRAARGRDQTHRRRSSSCWVCPTICDGNGSRSELGEVVRGVEERDAVEKGLSPPVLPYHMQVGGRRGQISCVRFWIRI